MNIRAWKDMPFIQNSYASNIELLEKQLLDLAATASAQEEIEWKMRQIMYQRI